MINILMRKIMPKVMQQYLQERLAIRKRRLKAPRMIWGYRDASGAWRERTRMSDTVFIYHPESVCVADNVFVWHYTILDGTGGLEIGEGTQIGAWVGIFTHSSHLAIRLLGNHYQEVPEKEKRGYKTAPVKIGKYVFIAAGAKVLPGVTIGDGALVSAASIVKRDVGPFEIVSSDPAKVIGSTRKLDERYLSDPQILEWYQEWQKD